MRSMPSSCCSIACHKKTIGKKLTLSKILVECFGYVKVVVEVVVVSAAVGGEEDGDWNAVNDEIFLSWDLRIACRLFKYSSLANCDLYVTRLSRASLLIILQ